MDKFNLITPVAFFIFKREEQTRKVFQTIARARPPKLYIVADGPRNPAEGQDCESTRRVVEQVDWDCLIYKDYADENLGVRARIITGLDWVFRQEEKVIILEDDCLPHQSFFRYCQELLTFYQDDPEVMHISGDNFLYEPKVHRPSYYFSKYAHVWGWATWRRAWNLFQTWNFTDPPFTTSMFQSDSEKAFWLRIFQQIKSKELNYTWDYQWAVVCMAYRGLCVMPNVNLISNIGFGEEATNTRDISNLANIPAQEMSFPLMHPKKQWNRWADERTARLFFQASPPSILSRLRSLMTQE